MQNISKVDEANVSWDENSCKLLQRKCQYKCYQSDIKYHMTLKTKYKIESSNNLLYKWHMPRA